MPQDSLATSFTRVKRAPQRGSHDRDTLYDILDGTPICHVGHLVDGRPVVTPTCHWRIDDDLYWHGSRISRTIVESENNQVCVTVTHLDGLVLARSAFHHSANYRSALVFGAPGVVEEDSEKEAVLKAFIDRLFPGRWDALRPVNRKEMNATTVLKLPITEASAKVRTGAPVDDKEDLDWPIWAGVLPINLSIGEADPAPDAAPGQLLPENLFNPAAVGVKTS